MQVILAKENRLPIVAVEVYVKAGSSSESYKQSGLASMLVNMLTKGTKRYNADEIFRSAWPTSEPAFLPIATKIRPASAWACWRNTHGRP